MKQLALTILLALAACSSAKSGENPGDGGMTDDGGGSGGNDAPGTPMVGGACTSDADCSGTKCNTETTTGYPGGLCTSTCDTNNPNSCPAGSACVGGTCEDSCSSEADCRAGYSCFDIGQGKGACMPDCESNADCPGTGVCNPYSGYCEAVGVKGKDGAACTAHSDCESGWCLIESVDGRPGGVCTSECSPKSGFCPDNGYCQDQSQTPNGPTFAYCLQTCGASTDCRDGYSCFEWTDTVGACWPDCTNDAQCTGTGTCDEYSGFCEAQQGAPDGAACASNNDCASSFCATEGNSGNPGGICRSYCDPTATNACPDGGYCVDVGTPAVPGVYGICLDTCANNTQCRPGYVCLDEGLSAGLCEANCESNADCPATSTCNVYSGFCEATGTKGRDGAACTTYADCESGWCFTETNSGRPGGTCLSICNPTTNFCPDSGLCVDASASPNGPTFAYCADTCASAADCRAGYSCFDWTDTSSVCTPDCTSNAQCPATMTCNVYSGYCEATVGAVDGAACNTGQDCASGICATETAGGFPHGTCRSECDPTVANSCPDGGVCFNYNNPNAPAPGVYGQCWDGCTTSSQCRPGYSCYNTGGGIGACFPDCSADSQCANTAVGCNEYSGYCEPLGTGANDGAACTTNAQCKSGLCDTQTDYGYPGGMCVSECDPNAPFCPGDGVCSGQTGVFPSYGNCLDTCTASSQCRAGYGCWKNTSTGPGFCSADCTSNAQCPGGTCNPYSGYCEAVVGQIDGGPCVTGADCASGVCEDANSGWPGGYCISFCTPTRPGCPSDAQDGVTSACFADATYGDFGVCYDGCTANSQCRIAEGYVCQAFQQGSICY